MPVLVVPASAAPGLINSSTLQGLEAVCNVGSRAGTKDGSVDAWVQVTITPVGNAAGSGPVTPDAWGRFMHVCIEFTQPQSWRGKRRRQVPAFSYDAGPSSMYVECDPGFFWIGSWAALFVTGGTVGDKYNVTMTTATAKQEADARCTDGEAPYYQVDVMEPACEFQLTAISTAVDINVALPGFAEYHSRFRLVSGVGSWGGVALAARPGSPVAWLPMGAPITTGPATVYQTGGGV